MSYWMKFHLHTINLFLLLSSSTAASYLAWKASCLDLKHVIWNQYIQFVHFEIKFYGSRVLSHGTAVNEAER